MDTNEQNTTVEFNGLILGFSSAALYYLGETPIDGQQVKSVNFSLARQNIDILSMLKEKTQGNLTPEEAKLLSEVLADLQIKFANALRK